MISDAPVDNRLHDICVVGAGPVGISLALELAELGREVLLLESGGQTRSAEAQALSAATILDPARHDDMSIAVSRQLGGTSALWGGRCVPYDPVDFERRAALPDKLWPIGFEVIAPYYERACRYAACGDPVFAELGGGSSADEFTHSTLERWSNRPRFGSAYYDRLAESRAIDVRLNRTVAGFHLDGSGSVLALDVADAFGSKQLVRARRFVLCAGGVETTRLLLALQRLRPSALGGQGGALGRFYMGHIIGEIADVRLANDAIDRAMDFYVDSHGSYVRRRFVPTEATQEAASLGNIAFWPVVPPIADPDHRSGALSLIATALSVAGSSALLPEAIRKRHIPPEMPFWPHIKNMIFDVGGVLSFFPKFLFQRYLASTRHPALYLRNPARRYGLSYHAEHLPNAESRLSLTDDLDRFGLPRVKIDLRFQVAEAEWVVRAHHKLDLWLRDQKLGALEYRQPVSERCSAVMQQASHGTHQIGLARMAAHPESGVVDSNLQSFGINNLYVASTAVLPTSSQANPTLTTIALAVRLAEHLARQL